MKHSNQAQKLLVITGPTAVGKSSLACWIVDDHDEIGHAAGKKDVFEAHMVGEARNHPRHDPGIAKIDKKEAVIDWRETAEQIANNIRAFNAWPVANTLFQDAVLKIWEAIDLVETSTLSPGTIVRVEKESFFVATGNGVLQVMSVQLPAKKRISAADFINAHNASLMPGKTKLG